MDVNTASRWPTISGVTTTVRQPIRSADPRAKPNVTSLPVRGSGRLPQLFLYSLRSGLVPRASLISC
jgi:hypothetical protein